MDAFCFLAFALVPLVGSSDDNRWSVCDSVCIGLWCVVCTVSCGHVWAGVGMCICAVIMSLIDSSCRGAVFFLSFDCGCGIDLRYFVGCETGAEMGDDGEGYDSLN